MNICFLGHFTAGGTEKATFTIANGLCQSHTVCIVNTCDNAPFFSLNGNIEMAYMEQGSIFKKNLWFVHYLKKKQIDILITVEAMTGIYSIVASKMVKCKHIVWEHANYYQNQGSKYIQIIRQLELLLVDAYVVLTKRDSDNFQRNFKCKTHLQYIYNVADERKKTVYDIASKCIISVGHIRKIKNFIAIPEIGKLVFARHPDWCWKIFGKEEGEEYERVMQKVNEYGLEQNIIFCGRSNQMDREYQGAAMYVMTSLQEGLPMVLLEAKSNGLPLVSFDIQTGPAEIIREGVNGYLVPPYDVEAMAGKICQLIEDEQLRKEFSNQASHDLDKFDNKTVIAKWNKLIELVDKNELLLENITHNE